jgi:hypothetical protein
MLSNNDINSGLIHPQEAKTDIPPLMITEKPLELENIT